MTERNPLPPTDDSSLYTPEAKAKIDRGAKEITEQEPEPDPQRGSSNRRP